MLSNFNLTFPLAPAISIVFVVFLLLFILIGSLAVYSLLHFGRSRIVGALASAVFSILALILIIDALVNLSKL